jgi:hypothetical protein
MVHSTAIQLFVFDSSGNQNEFYEFDVLTATNMKISVLWDVAPCSLVDVYRLSEECTAWKGKSEKLLLLLLLLL